MTRRSQVRPPPRHHTKAQVGALGFRRWRDRPERRLVRGPPTRGGVEGWAYARAMRTLYLATAGRSDPTRASIPLHLAVNGSLEVGHEVSVVLAGDATELLKTGVRDALEGVGVPAVRDLLAKARQHDVAIH